MLSQITFAFFMAILPIGAFLYFFLGGGNIQFTMLLHRTFGWDYIAWRNTVDSGIARIHLDQQGRPFYWRYKITKVIDRLDALKCTDIVWLTCKPSKYGLKDS